jgi:hypothetical protein
VTTAQVLVNRESGRSRGFGFVIFVRLRARPRPRLPPLQRSWARAQARSRPPHTHTHTSPPLTSPSPPLFRTAASPLNPLNPLNPPPPPPSSRPSPQADQAAVARVFQSGRQDANGGTYHRLQGKDVEVKKAMSRERMRENAASSHVDSEASSPASHAMGGGASVSPMLAAMVSPALGGQDDTVGLQMLQEHLAGGGGAGGGGALGLGSNAWSSQATTLAERLRRNGSQSSHLSAGSAGSVWTTPMFGDGSGAALAGGGGAPPAAHVSLEHLHMLQRLQAQQQAQLALDHQMQAAQAQAQLIMQHFTSSQTAAQHVGSLQAALRAAGLPGPFGGEAAAFSSGPPDGQLLPGAHKSSHAGSSQLNDDEGESDAGRSGVTGGGGGFGGGVGGGGVADGPTFVRRYRTVSGTSENFLGVSSSAVSEAGEAESTASGPVSPFLASAPRPRGVSASTLQLPSASFDAGGASANNSVLSMVPGAPRPFLSLSPPAGGAPASLMLQQPSAQVQFHASTLLGGAPSPRSAPPQSPLLAPQMQPPPMQPPPMQARYGAAPAWGGGGLTGGFAAPALGPHRAQMGSCEWGSGSSFAAQQAHAALRADVGADQDQQQQQLNMLMSILSLQLQQRVTSQQQQQQQVGGAPFAPFTAQTILAHLQQQQQQQQQQPPPRSED